MSALAQAPKTEESTSLLTKTSFPTQNWRVLLAFRCALPTDKCAIRCRSRLCTGEFIHVELMFRRPCGRKECMYRKAAGGESDEAHDLNMKAHLVSYSIVDMPGDNRLKCVLERDFRARRAWSFLELDGLSNKQIDDMEKFAIDQQGAPYNACGYYWNFLCCGVCCVHGTRTDALLACAPCFKRPWFCSEFVCAALIIGGFDIKQDPARCTPQHLWDYLQENRLAVARLYSQVESLECTDYEPVSV